MGVFFITGIDTGCGKTYVTGIMAKALKDAGINVITQKLLQTGCTGISEDILEHRRLMGCDLFPEDTAGITCSYVFPFPASPYLAARLDHKEIDIELLSKATDRLSEKYDIVLIEGAGGLFVPVTMNLFIIDYIKMHSYPVVLVSSSKLGSINHTLLSIESCASHGIQIHALVYNRFPFDSKILADDSYQAMTHALFRHYPQARVVDLDGKIEMEKITHQLFSVCS